MRNFIYIIYILTIFQGCKSDEFIHKDNPLTYYYLKYDIECCTELQLSKKLIQYSHTIIDSIYTLNYVYFKNSIPYDTITYKLKDTDNFIPKYYINGQEQDNLTFLFVSSSDYTTDKKYKVYKYAKNPLTIDGCSTYFWVPEFGIILKKSTTWGNFQKLRTNNDSINHKIDLLTELIYQDIEFYYGCVEKMEIIPKDDAEEFYKWKFKQLKK